jgi:hypothetical protein
MGMQENAVEHAPCFKIHCTSDGLVGISNVGTITIYFSKIPAGPLQKNVPIR